MSLASRHLAAPGARPAVHQFQTTTSYGDAVTRGVLLTRDLLRELGFASDVYVAGCDPRLRHEFRSYQEYRAGSADLLLVHHSIGHHQIEWVLGLPEPKMLVYHNITPAEYFPDDPHLRHLVEIGRQQLAAYRSAVTGAICDSAFNAAELSDLGYRAVTVVPLLVTAEDLGARPFDRRLVDANTGIFTLLFVGRVERNKCQHDVIEVFRRVDRWIGRRAQCILVGNYNPCAAYVHELRQHIAVHGLADRVRLIGHASDDERDAWYRAADVFLCMSEHEGFGVPLLEAMACDVPVIAHASTSVPATLGGAGILVEGKPLDAIAGLICLLADDAALRARVIARQRERLAAFSRTHLRAELAAVLEGAGLRTARTGAVTANVRRGEACSGSTITQSAPTS